jgi:adenylate kinase family enzyme
MKILLTGVPGTGKTTIGKYLATKHEFYHQDMESNAFEPVRQANSNISSFLENLRTHQNIVVTWGFGPFTDRPIIDALMADEYILFWLDGDRIASFVNFMHREKHNDKMEYLYYLQMMNIVSSNIINQLKPTLINPFLESGKLRPIGEITIEILQIVNK